MQGPLPPYVWGPSTHPKEPLSLNSVPLGYNVAFSERTKGKVPLLSVAGLPVQRPNSLTTLLGLQEAPNVNTGHSWTELTCAA